MSAEIAEDIEPAVSAFGAGLIMFEAHPRLSKDKRYLKVEIDFCLGTTLSFLLSGEVCSGRGEVVPGREPVAMRWSKASCASCSTRQILLP